MPTATPDASQGSDCQPTRTTPTATVDTRLDNLISSETGPGWVAGDATYSTELPDGQEAFVFSDTLIGTAQANGVANLTGMVHNSELVGNMSGLTSDAVGAITSMDSDIEGTEGAPQTLIPDTTDSGDQWQVAATFVENGNQLVFVNELAPVAGSEFDRFTGHSGIAVLRLPAAEYRPSAPSPPCRPTRSRSGAMRSHKSTATPTSTGPRATRPPVPSTE